MAQRPVFIPRGEAGALVQRVSLEMQWHGGFALSQSRKNISALHAAAAAKGIRAVLEISTRSATPLGVQLSAFNLQVSLPGLPAMSVEAAFQGSKVFEGGGPYHDLYTTPGREVKRDARLTTSGPLKGFLLGDSVWPLEPRTAFYDWLYLSALQQNPQGAEALAAYDGFSDIAFNPARSINCQARSAALFVALQRRGWLSDALTSQDSFLKVLEEGAPAQAPTPTVRLALPNARGRKKSGRVDAAQYELFA